MSATRIPVRYAWTCPRCKSRQPRGTVRHQNGWCQSCDKWRCNRTRKRIPVRDPDITVAELAAREDNDAREAQAAAAAAAAAEAARLRLEELGEVARLMTQMPRR